MKGGRTMRTTLSAAFLVAFTACGGEPPPVIAEPTEQTPATPERTCCECLVFKGCFFTEHPAEPTVDTCVTAVDGGDLPGGHCVAGTPDTYAQGICTAECAAVTQE